MICKAFGVAQRWYRRFKFRGEGKLSKKYTVLKTNIHKIEDYQNYLQKFDDLY
jgi:hypothetical protein